MPTEKKEPMIFLTKATKDQFQDNILKHNFHPKQSILLSQHQDLANKSTKLSLSKNGRFSALILKAILLYWLLHSTHNTTVNLDRMCLIYSIVKGRKIDVGEILHQKITDCTARETRILGFPSLIMLLCQQKGIVSRDDEEVMENKGPINEAFIERMTHGKDKPTMKEEKTSNTGKGKTKAESKGTNLTTDISLLHKMKDIKKWGQFYQQ